MGLCFDYFTRKMTCNGSSLVAHKLLLLLYVFGSGLAVVESQACYPPLPYLFQGQLFICCLLKPSYPPSVGVRGPRYLAQTYVTWEDPD